MFSKDLNVKPQFKDKYYVYALCRPNGIPFYIGKGKNDRINVHFQKAQLSTKSIKNDFINHYKDSVKREIVAYFDSESSAFDYEEWLISQYGRIVDGGILANTLKFNKDFPVEKIKEDRKYNPNKYKTFSISLEKLEDCFKMLITGNYDAQDVSKATGVSASVVSSVFFRKDSRKDDLALLMDKYKIYEINYNYQHKFRKESLTVDKIKYYHKMWLDSEMSIGDISRETGYSHDNINRIFLGKQMRGVIDHTLKPLCRKTVVTNSKAQEIIKLRYYEKLSYSKISKIVNLAKSTVQRVAELKGSNARFTSLAEHYKKIADLEI